MAAISSASSQARSSRHNSPPVSGLVQNMHVVYTVFGLARVRGSQGVSQGS